MTYVDKQGWYLKGRYLGGTLPEVERALDQDTRRKLIQEYILVSWDIYDVARWISDGARMPSDDDVITFALDYIKHHHGYETAGRPLAGVYYGVVNRSYNIAPGKASKSKASAGKTVAKKQANKAPARRR